MNKYSPNYHALSRAYSELKPFSDKQRWEFDNNLAHLDFLTSNLSKTGLILDSGSYIGILALALKFLGYTVDGSDKFLFIPDNPFYVSNITELKRIWDKHGLRVINQDVLHNPPIKLYDTVLSVAVIEHQPYPRLYLEGLKRCVKSKGVIYVATPNVANLANRMRFLLGRPPVHNTRQYFLEGDKFNGHWREYTLGELKEMFVLADIQTMASRTCQSMRPKLGRFNKIPLGITRIMAHLVESWGDTNQILGQVA